MSKIIEVEGSEIALRNKAGDVVIIPKKYRLEVEGMIKEGCHGCIDNLVETLPVMEDYAEDGSIYPKEPPFEPYIAEQSSTRVVPGVDKAIPAKWEADKQEHYNTMDEIDFRERYGTSKHRYRYDNDPTYNQKFQKQAREAKSTIAYPTTDLRRGDNVAPNTAWMYPNLKDEAKAKMTQFSNEVIEMGLPIPGLEAMGKIPSVFKAGKNLIKPVSKAVNKPDDILKLYHYSNNPELLLDDIDPFRPGISQTKKRYKNLPIEELPSGFYTNPNKYASFMGGKVGYELQLPKNINIKDLAAMGRTTDRISQKELKQLAEEGYDVIKGRNMIGHDEVIVLNKDKIINFNNFGDRYTKTQLKELFPDKNIDNMSVKELDDLVDNLKSKK